MGGSGAAEDCADHLSERGAVRLSEMPECAEHERTLDGCEERLGVELYRTIPTLREYVDRVASRAPHHRALARGRWDLDHARGDHGGKVRVASLKAELAADDVYRKSSVR